MSRIMMRPGRYWPMALVGALLGLMACGALAALVVLVARG